MCIVDYKGFRVVAHADYKSDYCSLVHNIETDNPKIDKGIHAQLTVKGMALNLKPHTVMLKNDSKHTIHLSSGIQVQYSIFYNLMIKRRTITRLLI